MPIRTELPAGAYDPVPTNSSGSVPQAPHAPAVNDTDPTPTFVRCPLQPINPASPDTLRDFYILRRGMPIRRMLPPKPLAQ